jgi:hypothetical protein
MHNNQSFNTKVQSWYNAHQHLPLLKRWHLKSVSNLKRTTSPPANLLHSHIKDQS